MSKRMSIDTVLNFSSGQNEQSTLEPSQPTIAEEYELHLEPPLLRYLKESPKANKELEEELTSVSCSAKLFPEDGRVLVQGLTQPDAANNVTDWKVEVDKVFDGYLCHYEAEPHKVKALLQSCGSPQATDEVKVYSEDGVAAVVGKRSQVNAMMKEVEDLCVKRSTRSSKKQTSRRLGKAKLRLLWEVIEHNIGQDFPEVKVTQKDEGQIGLEGALEKIRKAGDLISNMEQLVFEKTVSNLSLHFLAFLRKAYGEPGVLSDFLGVEDKVEIELRDAELHIFTLNADKLDDTEKKLLDKFKEDTFYIPNCSTVPSELQQKLKCKVLEMNQGSWRAQVVFGSDNKVCLLGHKKEFEALSEVVEQFILDQASIEGKITLPFTELARELPELLKLHKLDYSGVTIRPLTSSPEPTILLEGPAGKVTEVRNRLSPFLDSLVMDRFIIDMPGAGRYFQSPSGRENILSVAHSQKCLLQLQEQPHISRKDLASGTVATYGFQGGLKVLVCHGDITKQDADALVNAANEKLEHGGGVAAALSKAGGPAVQKESRLLIKRTGNVPTGNVVVTTGGDLKCKVLLHAVGPVGGISGGRERELLEKAAQSALELAELMEFKSIAMPCISSGLFGVPVTVCSEAIVTAVKKFGSQEGRSLSRITLIDNKEEVVRAMKDACDKILQGITVGTGTPDQGFPMSASARDAGRGATAALPGDDIHIEVVQGTIETQQVDCLVCPMVGHDPLSTRVGKNLVSKVGPELTTKLNREARGAMLPGDIVILEGLPALNSRGVAFLNLISWDNKQDETAVQVLRHGIRKILASCGIRGYSSVAFPVLGTGVALRFPHSVASRVLLEEVKVFEQNRVSRAAFRVRFVIHPNDKESSKTFQSAQEQLRLRGFTNDANPDQASFYRHVSITNDEVTAMLGGVKLEMVNGDIVHETTDVIVNTTDFSSNQSGVSKAILTAAGPTVQAELANVGIPADHYYNTGPGLLGCKEIIHASFRADPQLFRKNCKKILKHCESKGYCSASFPAINTGAAGMDLVKACQAILDGMTSAITDVKPSSLSLIRIVILEQPIFQTFRSELENRFGLPATRHLTAIEKAKQKFKNLQKKKGLRTSATSPTQVQNYLSSKPPPAVMSVISRGGPDTVRTIKRDLEGFLQKQLVERKVDVHDFSRLEPMELEAVQAKISALAMSLEYQKYQGSQGADGNRAARGATRDWSASVKDVYVLKGLKEDVLSVVELVHRAIHKALQEDLQDKGEAMLAFTTQWSIQDPVSGVWHELSLRENYMLEQAHLNNEMSEDATAPDGMKVTINMRAREATNWTTGATYKVKRNNTDTVLELPADWEPMEDQFFKKVELQPTSTEYQAVARGFLRTAKYNICKIERVQNVYQWHAYTVCKQRILANNGAAELGEKSLYHGTSAEACNCIERDKFDRGYTGAHGARYGKGVYFAVNADYSARTFSPADASGLKRLYVARVLTGRYTVGDPSLKAAPPRGSDPTDCFNSVVDNMQRPTMFVVFHDDQAYPEYLITFK
ncbi:protein mono-ADP-ribosyltransferase PARP14-like isoform X2 [Notolabrus celidotus]|uniref:protein mono-ADP-ribosyltransferase PARP14-like isoform X2 n=1 Tax=Notolabrus celidotus TaxID=1203425 RepID=UPI00148FC483|nr:protein mono-ADP-ribosyltransferase PARP14-like isoform X2 [Notolabrus celidotus]